MLCLRDLDLQQATYSTFYIEDRDAVTHSDAVFIADIFRETPQREYLSTQKDQRTMFYIKLVSPLGQPDSATQNIYSKISTVR